MVETKLLGLRNKPEITNDDTVTVHTLKVFQKRKRK